MDKLIMAGQIILALAILVTLHELGHFAAARMFGIKVEKFYLFFDAWGKKLFSFKYKDTEYGIGWLPLGGYVKIAGMIDESMDTDQLKSEPQPWEFRSKPAWQRLIVMIGGVTVNLILGIIISICILWGYGEKKLPLEKVKYGIYPYVVGKEMKFQEGDVITGINGKKVEFFQDLKKPSVILGDGIYFDVIRNQENIKVSLPSNISDRISDKKEPLFDYLIPCVFDSIIVGMPAEKAGLKKGDQVIAINDTAIKSYNTFAEKVPLYAGKACNFKVLRGNDTIDFKINVNKEGKVGTHPADPYEKDIIKLKYSLGKSIPLGTSLAFETLADQLTGMKKLVSGKIDPRKSLQGPIGIAALFGPEWIWFRFWTLTGLLSLILAFMNLLPIPALDGGHVVFLIIEMIIRRPLSDKFMQVMQVIGMVILLSLMVFAFGNDFYRIFTK
ncbi:MAG TPA: RIP metalloprotease RseP [Bacteroidia bacterium]